MKKIFINTRDKFIYSNIAEYLTNYFGIDIVWIQGFSEKNIDNISKEDCIIALYNENDVAYYNTLQVKMFLILAPITLKETNLKKCVFLHIPIYLPELLNYIKIFINENSNKIILSIPDYDLVLDYGDGLVKSKKLDQIIKFTSTEGNILKKLFSKYPNYVEKKDLSNNYADSNSLDTHIFNIKKKFLEKKFGLEILRNKEFYKISIKE